MAGSSPAMTVKIEPSNNSPLGKLKLAGRLLLLAAILVGIVIAWLHRDALSPSTIEAALSHSRAAPILFLAGHVVASLLFIPRALVAAAAGLMFGLWWGLVWATLGSVFGSVAGFLVARYLNYALGLTKVRFGDYLLGSFLGQIPSTVAFVEFGAAGAKLASGKAGWLWPMLVGLAALAIAFALRRLFQRRMPSTLR